MLWLLALWASACCPSSLGSVLCILFLAVPMEEPQALCSLGKCSHPLAHTTLCIFSYFYFMRTWSNFILICLLSSVFFKWFFFLMKILLFVLARNMSGFAQCPFLTMHSYLQGNCGCLVWCVHQLPSLRDNLSGSSAGTTGIKILYCQIP